MLITQLFRSIFRYKDARVYSQTLEVWRASFDQHLRRVNHSSPQRAVRIAFDFLLNFEKEKLEQVNFSHLTDAKKLRDILDAFREGSSVNSTSKIKYLKTFHELVKFLLLDVSSPEKVNNEAFTMTKIDYEFKSTYEILSKFRGLDVAVAKQRASKTIIPEAEIALVIKEARRKLNKVLDDDQSIGLEDYSEQDAQDVRDHLILVAASRLGQRSKELMTMTISEVNDAEEEKVRYFF